ncbi:hypothetical protein BpHYR1_027401 [Brachionus plicatilis]|uniref:Retrovirus-related Pol poly from transposon n=1 Tax=Brachionus plicatilis TaxID=10195 RepID=A0A3M7Q3I6_BRAPC|nr:hypothetical protein BpHYR1_027401 [Brachionus plicatilis]
MEETCIEQLEPRLLIRNPNATYEEIIKISSKLFGRNPINNDPMMEFVHRTQLQNETIFQFMFELENLAAKAYLQHNDRYRKPIIVDRFIRGSRDNKVQSELCQTETIETIQEVLDKANKLEIGFQKCKQIIEGKNSRTNEIRSKNNPNNYNNLYDQFNQEAIYSNQHYQKPKPKVSFLSNNKHPNLKTKNATSLKFSKNLQLAKQLHHPKSHSYQNLKLPTNNATFLNANEQQISNYSSTVAENLESDCQINDILTHFQIDTGSDITAISEKSTMIFQMEKR